MFKRITRWFSILPWIIVPTFVPALWYLVGAFILWETKPEAWPEVARFLYVLMTFSTWFSLIWTVVERKEK